MKNLSLLIILLVTAGLSSTASAKNKYNKDYFGETIIHKAIFEDTLIHLARNNGIGFVELRAANPTLDAWIPGAGAKIILPKQHILPEASRNGLVINLAEMRVYYFKDEGQPPQTYPLSIGREGLQTPTGSTKIVRKKDGPTWRPTARMREEDPELPASVGPGPENPLGTHALYLGWPQYLIHGTNKPYGVGRRVSSGCMRMYPEDIKTLWPQVPVGTKVTVVDQPVKVGWIEDSLYVEVSPTQDQSLKIEEDGVLKTYEITVADMKLINKKAGVYADKIDWEVVRNAVHEHRGYPVEVLNVTGRVLKKQARSEEAQKVKVVVSETPVKEEDAKPDIYPATEATQDVTQDVTQAEVTVNSKTKTNFNLNN